MPVQSDSIRTYWFTGLSGAGKTTLAYALSHALTRQSHNCCVLDGDELRAGLCRDLGFSPADREENMRRVAHLARLLNDQGINTVVALISPTVAGRSMARQIISEARFTEIHVSTPLKICQERDAKGLYAKAKGDRALLLTGLKAPYEVPISPDLSINTADTSTDEAIRRILDCRPASKTSP